MNFAGLPATIRFCIRCHYRDCTYDGIVTDGYARKTSIFLQMRKSDEEPFAACCKGTENI